MKLRRLLSELLRRFNNERSPFQTYFCQMELHAQSQ
jgi:hypothetical protein